MAQLAGRNHLTCRHWVTIQGERATAWQAVNAYRLQGLPHIRIRKAKVSCGEALAAIFVDGEGLICAFWRSVVTNVHGQHGSCCATMAIADGVGDRNWPSDIGRWGEVDGTVAVNSNSTFAWVNDRRAHYSQRVIVWIAVICQYINVLDRGVDRGARHIVHRHRWIVHWRHGDGFGCGRTAAVAVGDDVREAHRAGVVGIRGEGDGAVGGHRYRAVGYRDGLCGARGQGHAVDAGDAQRVAVNVAVAGQWFEYHAAVFGHGIGVVHRHRCYIFWVVYRHGGGIGGLASGVAHGVADRGRVAFEAVFRCEGDRAITVYSPDSFARHGQCFTIGA